MITKTKVRLIVGTIVAGTFSGLLVALIFKEMPQGNTDVLNVLIGFLGGAFTTMVAFYFGDSEGKD